MGLSDRISKAKTNIRGEEPVAEAPPVDPDAPDLPSGIHASLVTTFEHEGPKKRDALPPGKRDAIHKQIISKLGPKLFDGNLKGAELDDELADAIRDAFAANGIGAYGPLFDQFSADIRNDVIGYGPIEEFLDDDSVTEIMVNGPNCIFVERAGRTIEVASGFADESHVRRVIDKIVSQIGRRIDESSPMVDARLPDGSRVNAVIPPLAIDGPFLTIRKFAKEPWQIQDLIKFGTLDERAARFLKACIEGKLNVIVSGGTGTGKTTLLNVLSGFIPSHERIITVEDAKELQLHQRHVLCMETRPANVEGKGEVIIRDLVKNSLRMRPDRIVVGECRGGEALDMLQAMNTGHDGSMTTVHSNSPRDALSRIETLTLMAGFDLPIRAIREQVASAVDLIVQLNRFRDGSRRVTHITEVEGMEGEVITVQDIFLFDYSAGFNHETGKLMGQLQPTGVRPRFSEKLADNGVNMDPEIFGVETVTLAQRMAALR
jgi:pilus assembly protein CpaF